VEETVGQVEDKERRKSDSGNDQMPKHVGGVDDELGGVDPDIDQLLMRLSEGP